MSAAAAPGHVVALSGGVGGARFVAGLQAVLAPGALTVVVNTGDDFDHLGLRICPDIDSVVYGLAGLSDESRGWGRAHETWNCLEVLTTLGSDDWFALGDRDMGVHLCRSDALRKGRTLTEVTQAIASRFGVVSRVVPMTDSKVATVIRTDEGELSFQDYFVRYRCEPLVRGLRYDGVNQAALPAEAIDALQSPDLHAIFIAPSNPFLSVDPILAMPGVRAMLRDRSVPIIAVSPLISGKAIKGPLTSMMDSLGVERSARGLIAHYGDIVDALVVDRADSGQARDAGVPVRCLPTLMTGAAERIALARQALDFAGELADA
jgi:LPPG:FO 2-phospho-L-lactate transferase